MTRLILDHFRRWWWLLALSTGLAFVLGWCMAAPAGYEKFAHRGALGFVFGWLKTQSLMLEFSSLNLAMLTGVFLLSFDVKRGVIRVVGLLPLTHRQIGRSWWLATVALPAMAMVAVLFLGAGTFCFSHPHVVFPAQSLAITSLFTLVYLGVMFTGVLTPQPAFSGTGRARTWAVCLSLLSSVLMLSGLWFFQQELKHLVLFALYLGTGACLTAFGWCRAGRFDLGRATQPNVAHARRPGLGHTGFRLTPLAPQHRAPAGYGGIPFLISTVFARTFWFGVVIVGVIAVVIVMTGRLQPGLRADEFWAVMGLFFPFWIVVFQLMPVLRHLRFLRTLPLSATRLAAVTLALAILPLLAFGVVVTGAAGLLWGTSAALALAKVCLLNLIPAVLCIFFGVWRGAGIQANTLVLLTMVGFQIVWVQLAFRRTEIPFHLAGACVALSVLVVFLLTRLALMRGRRTYHVHGNSHGDAAWGMGRQA